MPIHPLILVVHLLAVASWQWVENCPNGILKVRKTLANCCILLALQGLELMRRRPASGLPKSVTVESEWRRQHCRLKRW